MASKKALNAKNLEMLGSARLAELLIDISKGNAEIKRRLRLELADATSLADLVREIRKTLTSIDQSHTFIEGHKRKAFIADLAFQHRTIVERVAKHDPTEALDLLWRFLALAHSVFELCDDSSGTIIGIFHAVCDDLEWVAEAAKPDPIQLAEKTYRALIENDYGQYDYLIEALTPVLGTAGLDHLKRLFHKVLAGQSPNQSEKSPEIEGRSTDGPRYTHRYREGPRDITVQLALQKIADAQGDVDAFIEQESENAKSFPMVAARIAQRLLAAGRTDEAWQAIEAVDKDRMGRITHEWELVRLDILETLGRDEAAQAFRLQCFERSLHAAHLRAYLKRLPDFEDLEAEENALSFVLSFSNVHQALAFLVSWPALDHAAELVLSRAEELDGNYYELLGPAADALEAKHPLVGIVLRRALVDYTLTKARSTRYRHAARHLLECESLNEMVDDYGQFESHDAYFARLQSEHSRKTSFWSLVS